MKKILYIFAFLCCITFTTGKAFAIPILSLDLLGTQKIKVGQSTTFVLKVTDLTDLLGAFEVDVSFDPNILSLERVQFASFLGSPDPLSFETITFVNTSVTGVVGLGEVSLLEDMANCIFCVGPYLDDLQKDATGNIRDSLILAAIVFKGVGVGTSDVRFNSVFDLGDAFGNSLPTLIRHGESIEVPEPASLILLGTGLVGMFGLRRRIIKRIQASPNPNIDNNTKSIKNDYIF